MATSENPIRAYRLRQSPPLKLEELAELVGTTKGNLSRVETDKQPVTADGPRALLPKLVAETGIPAAELRPDLAELFCPPDKAPRRRPRRAA